MSLLRIWTDVAAARETLLRRLSADEIEVPERIKGGMRRIFGEELSPEEAVRRILADVRSRGDAAVREWTRRIDGTERERIEVSPDEIAAAKASIAPDLLAALELAASRIRAFHQRQHIPSWIDLEMGGTLGQIVRPLQRVGIYAPGGTAPLPSSLLMAAIPARVAGVAEIVVASPPERATGRVAPITLAAAALAGVDRVFCIGGAQAIGALAYGTASVPRVDKICGPGNLFVTLAKRQVFGAVGIDG
ncbi:MAG: histidinol dehydrogenase, partial [Chloroflexi bacterium]|nr:histidinol dehydrogenase [Chloroflexota bacterium]